MNELKLDPLNDPIENNLRILIADDDLSTRILLTGILKKWGYDPLAVSDGRTTWEEMQRADSPRLVILDWEMPEMDGLEVIRRARANFSEQPLYIILLTGRDEKGAVLAGLETGANDYIHKPFVQEELYARIRVGQRTVELQSRLIEAKQILLHQATHDALTGIMSRRAILDQLTRELQRARRGGYCNLEGRVSIGFFDVDHFKQINDHYGHQIGDEVLCGVVKILNERLRAYDSLGRMGGDEFLIIAPDVTEESSRALYERLISAIAGYTVATPAGKVPVTVSMGVCTADLDSSEDRLLSTADAAMYQAKRKGGNCVVFAG
jgi:diguanylate cyclase (GGDEF)-like protein